MPGEGALSMYKRKTNWDYFCELLVAVPGLTTMFDITPKVNSPAEVSFRKSQEAEERPEAKGTGPGSGQMFDDAVTAARAEWEKRGNTRAFSKIDDSCQNVFGSSDVNRNA